MILFLPVTLTILSTTTGSKSSPSDAITVNLCFSIKNSAGQTVPNELIIRNLYLLPAVTLKYANCTLVLCPVFGS